MSRRALRFLLNGAERRVEVEDRELLLDLLRRDGLTGAKRSCELEVCGACTVLLDGRSVSACMTLAVEANSATVETVEGLAAAEVLHPLQRAFLDRGAVECGFCTPGMLMAAVALLRLDPRPDREAVVAWMNGNLCRCGRYQQIIDAVLDVAGAMPARER